MKRDFSAFVLWFTGLPKSGKSTLADRIYKLLISKGIKAERLDGDVVRKNLSSDLGFSREDRDRNIARVAFVAKLLERNGIVVIASFVSPYRHQRAMVRKQVNNFIEVFVNTPLEVCERRDKNGLYRQAREGKIPMFTGISDPYEAPENPEIELKTENKSIEENINELITYLQAHGYF